APYNPALIPAPLVPGTFYDMQDVVWINTLTPPTSNSRTVEIEDGVKLRNFCRIEGNSFNLIYNGTTPNNWPIVASQCFLQAPVPLAAAAPGGISFFNVRMRILHTYANAQPMILLDSPGSIATFLDLRNGYIGIGSAPLPAPVLELPACTTVAIH